MLKKLKNQIILIEVSAFFLVTIIILASINLNTHYQLVKNAHQVLTMLAESDGVLQASKYIQEERDRYDLGFNSQMTVETQYTIRYFYVDVDEEGTVIDYNLEHIAAVDAENIEKYVAQALESNALENSVSEYWYLKVPDDSRQRIFFVDCYTQQNYVDYLMRTSLAIGCICMILVIVFVYFLAGKAIRPMEESLERQKRFITDAGHELKTPLAAISANVDVLELVSGENDVIQKIRRQIGQLTTLINEMLTLSRITNLVEKEEAEVFDFTEMVKSMVMDFEPIVAKHQKEMTLLPCEQIQLEANRKDINRLVSVLMDNAIKYCRDEGVIRIKINSGNRFLHFEIYNSGEHVQAESLKHLFDRFYRADSSRTRDTGSYGIGLSIAIAIIDKHKGKISVANVEGGVKFSFDLPLKR